ncbi:MAG: hypothetical protein IKZ07_03735 [Akkermansia sp.]|nr:hypothetical protein [Akkermansia sp.]
MTYTQFFTDSIAMTLADALSRAGIGLPVYGQVSDPEAEHDRVEVRCAGTEELIPGNYTTRLDCSVVLLASASANDAAGVEQMAAQVAPVVNGVLRRPWRHTPLADPRAETDAEYEQAPFIVLDLVPEPANTETEDDSYALQVDFRAYVQF